MKVQDIRSFFKNPSSSSSRSSRQAESEERVVEVPSRLIKGSSKKSKKDEDRLKISIERSDEDDSDKEDPLPKKARTQEARNGKGSKSKSRKPVIDDDDSDKEDPLPRSAREKKEDKREKKRKARVLSDSDDDDFTVKPSQSQKQKSNEKPLAKQPKVERSKESNQEDLKPVNPLDFFGKAPVRQTRSEAKDKVIDKQPVTNKSDISPEKKDKKSPIKVEPASPSRSPKAKPQNGSHHQLTSPQKPPTSLIEPKKLKMETATPEKREKQHSKSVKPEAIIKQEKVETEQETKTKKTPEKKEKDSTFKVPTPVTNDKSRSRTNSRRPNNTGADDDDDFIPKKKTSSSKSSKLTDDKSDNEWTPAKMEIDDDDEEVKEAAPKKQASTPKQNYMKYLAKLSMKPKNLGSKEIPVGAPNCLQGLTFVITGVLDSLERDDCKDVIVKYGGRVTGSVSGKTSYLVTGDEPGESKVNKAKQLKVPQISEDELLDMIRRSNPNVGSQDSGVASSEGLLSADSEQMKIEDDEMEYDPDKSLFASSSPSTSRASRSKTSSPTKVERSPSKLLKKEESSPKKRKIDTDEKKNQVEKGEQNAVNVNQEVRKEICDPKPSTSGATAPVPSRLGTHTDAELMWVDKYKPKTLKNVVGQISESSNARKLFRWLQNWFKYHGSSQDKPKAAWPGLKDPEGKTFKAALLSGPPGVGKTTTAHLAVKEVGYDYFELNASDTRNKRGLHENVADALSSKSLVFSRGNEELTRKHVLIMDEVDGMSGNEDRGGVQELIALIKSSRVPIICICNDRNHPKIRSLANYCFDLRFNKPSFEQLKAFIMSICFKEKMKIPADKIQQLIISTDNDVRQILHQLELFKEGKSDQAYNPKKDLKFGPWDVVRKVFLKSEHEKMSIHDKNGLFFQDYNIGPLFVQENYLKWTPAKAGGNRYKHLDLLSKTASSLADGDLVESVIRRSQNWNLLPVQAVFASYIPGEYMESNQMGNVEFPQWLGKNSNKSKRHRLLQSLHTHLHLHVSGSLEALNMDYLPYLRRAITKPLIAGDAAEAATVMEDYTLLREDVESITDLSLWPGSRDPMDKVETKVKTAFTRQVNKEILPYSIAKPVKGKGRGGGGTQEDDLEALLEEEGEAETIEEEEDDSLEKDAMVKVRTRKAGSSKSSNSAGKGKGKRSKGDEDDDDEDVKPAKSSKSSKSKQPTKPRKGK